VSPDAARDREEPGRVVLGRVVGAHGLVGELRVRFSGEGPEHVLGADRVFLSRASEPSTDARARAFEVVRAAPGRPGEVRLELRGIADREDARDHQGDWVLVEAAELPTPDAGEHYWYELIGCTAVDEAGRTIGRVKELWDTPGHDLLVIEDDAGAQHLVPAIDAFLREVDPEARRIVVAVIPGLLGDAGSD